MGRVILSGASKGMTKPTVGAPISELAVGSTVRLSVNGTVTDFLIVNQGTPLSTNAIQYDSSCNGTWLLMKNIYENRVWQSGNINKYESSDIHTYLNNTFLNLFESNIKDAIKQVKIPYRKNGGSGGSDQNGANGLLCKIFLLGGYEVGFTTFDSEDFPVDSAKLSYFASGTGTSANNKRIANLNGSAAAWWLRSPRASNADTVCGVYTNGDYFSSSAVNSRGIRPALILPSTLSVNKNGMVIA